MEESSNSAQHGGLQGQMKISLQENTTKEQLDLRRQVAQDLRKCLEEYPKASKGLKEMAAVMGIHEKTLKRLLESKNKPGYQTLLKIYRALYRTQNDTHLLDILPEVVRDHLKKLNPVSYRPNVNYSLDVEREINRDPVFCEIYFLAGTGGITKEYISYQYGVYGENLLEKMLKKEVLSSISQNKFTLGPNQASFGSETQKEVGLHLIRTFLKPQVTDQLGSNYIGLFASELNEEAYNKWLKIDKNAFDQKVALSKDPENKGDIKAFTFNSTDTLKPAKKELRH